jgi:hypothetical protein
MRSKGCGSGRQSQAVPKQVNGMPMATMAARRVVRRNGEASSFRDGHVVGWVTWETSDQEPLCNFIGQEN